MKEFLKILLVAFVSFMAGSYMHKCQPSPADSTGSGDCVTDTFTVFDTIPYIEPAPVQSQQTGYKQLKIPTDYIDREIERLPDIRADTVRTTNTDVTADSPDSITLRLPVTQNVYEGTGYKAYVSGIYPCLDSVFVYSRRETVTINKPPKRWHIGPTIGYGYTPGGFRPYIGISLTYSIFSF